MTVRAATAKRPRGLARDLGDGLTLRWASPADIDALAEFNARIHGGAGMSGDSLRQWTRDLMGGRHPTTAAGDFTIVTDERQEGRVVSCLCLISQTWSYDGVPFGAGRIELVGTDPEYRRKGLVRRQMAMVHRRSAERGERVQVITGIPWYYRQFGYEMALDLGGTRRQYWHQLVSLASDLPEEYALRRADEGDLPLLERLYAKHCSASMVYCSRDVSQWRWLLDGAHEEGFHYDVWMVDQVQGGAAGYVVTRIEGSEDALTVYEIATLPGYSLQRVCEFAGRALKLQVDRINLERQQPLASLLWALGTSHPAYEALGMHLGTPVRPYAWYLRIADLPAFLHHISPILERRLQGSIVDGYSGQLRLNFFSDTLALTFSGGTLAGIATYQRSRVADGDAAFPDFTFLQLLFGHRSMDELNYARPDCYVASSHAPLIATLFPRRPSCPLGLL